MEGNYKNFMKLLNSWPLDKSKAGRDLSQHIRDQVKLAFSKGEIDKPIDREKCNRYYASLKRIASNHYAQTYVRSLTSTASGLNREQCNLALNPEMLRYFEEEDRGVFQKLYQKTRNTIKNSINSQSLGRPKKYSDAVQIKEKPHMPVMANEVLQYLAPSKGKIYVDMTFGAGGHSTKILKSAPDIKIFALDRDPVAHEFAQELSQKYPGQIIPILGRFSELPQLLSQYKVEKNSIDGFLFDFGCSSMQFDIADRGFSIAKDGPLDMRMDGFRCPKEPTAADILAQVDETDLVHILKIYGEEKRAKKIARAIIDVRYSLKKLETTAELAELVESVVGTDIRKDQLGRHIHSATKTFQALRIFVNNELNEINYGIILAEHFLKSNGRLVTISFHSLEDTIVKRHISGNITNNMANKLPLKYSSCNKYYDENELNDIMKTPWKMLHKHVLTPTAEEVDQNPRARSAKFRAIVKN